MTQLFTINFFFYRYSSRRAASTVYSHPFKSSASFCWFVHGAFPLKRSLDLDGICRRRNFFLSFPLSATTRATPQPRPPSTPVAASVAGSYSQVNYGSVVSSPSILPSPAASNSQTPSPWAAMSVAGLPSAPQGIAHQSPRGLAYNPAAAVAAAAYMSSGLPAAQLGQGMAFYGAGTLPQTQPALTPTYPG